MIPMMKQDSEKQAQPTNIAITLNSDIAEPDAPGRFLPPTYQQSQSTVKENEDSTTSYPVGKTAPLGLCAFAFALFTYSITNIGSTVFDFHTQAIILPVPLFFGGLVQFVAGLYGFLSKDAHVGAAFVSYGTFWMFLASYMHLVLPIYIVTGGPHQITSLFLLVGFLFTFPITYVIHSNLRGFAAVCCWVLRILFACLITGNRFQIPFLINIGGYLGIAVATIVWCKGFSILLRLQQSSVSNQDHSFD